MVVNQLDAGDIFGRHDRRLPKALIGDHAAQMHNSVPDGDPELHRLPFILLDRCDHAGANVVIVGSWIRNVSRKTCDGAKQVGPRHDPDQRISAQQRANA